MISDKIKNRLYFDIPGQPIAKKRPRFFVRKTAKGIITGAENIQKTEEGLFVQKVLKKLADDFEIFKGPVALEIHAGLKRPKAHYGTGRNAGKIKDSAPLWPTTKPDFDNIAKFVCDVFNQLIWADDRQIISANVTKFYAENAHTLIIVSELEPEF